MSKYDADVVSGTAKKLKTKRKSKMKVIKAKDTLDKLYREAFKEPCYDSERCLNKYRHTYDPEKDRRPSIDKGYEGDVESGGRRKTRRRRRKKSTKSRGKSRRKRGAVRTKHNTPKVFDTKTMKVIPNPHFKKPSQITLSVQGQQVIFHPREVEQQRKMLTQFKKLSPKSNKGGRRKKRTRRRRKKRRKSRRSKRR